MKLEQLFEAKPKIDPELREKIISQLKEEWYTSGRWSSVEMLYSQRNPGVTFSNEYFFTQNFKKSCFEFLADGTIGIKDNAALQKLPVKCSYIKSATYILNVDGWKNFPSTIEASFYMNGDKLVDFNGAPTFGGSLHMSRAFDSITEKQMAGLTHVNGHLTIDSYEGDLDIFKHITINGALCLNAYVEGQHYNYKILPLMLTPGIKQLHVYRGIGRNGSRTWGPTESELRLKRANEIINKYIGQGKSGVLKAQAELQDNDFDEFV